MIITKTKINTIYIQNKDTKEVFEFQIKDFSKIIRKKVFKEFIKGNNEVQIIFYINKLIGKNYIKWNDCLNCKHYYFKEYENLKNTYTQLENKYQCKKNHNYDGVLRSRINAGIKIECKDFNLK